MTNAISSRPKVLAYYFPNYHIDPTNERRHGPGWTEWDLVKKAKPRFDGHAQPRIPARGYEDESDPNVMRDYVDLAASHGIDGFIFDWYWYDGGPYLHGALERGFLQADNNEQLEFSLMWANHDWAEVHPSLDPVEPDAFLASGRVNREEFERVCDHVIQNYFVRPNYTRIDGRPRFSIYELGVLIASLGGLEQTRDALEWFDNRAKEVGLPGVHLDVVVWSFAVLPSEVALTDPGEILAQLPVRSASSYVWIHHIQGLDQSFPVSADWMRAGRLAFEVYEKYRSELSVPFHPNVSAGWDPSPRTNQEKAFVEGHYPWIPTWEPSVGAFRQGLELAKEFASKTDGYSEVTLNAWNEWTEGSYLLPDELNGTAMLEAIRDVFGPREG